MTKFRVMSMFCTDMPLQTTNKHPQIRTCRIRRIMRAAEHGVVGRQSWMSFTPTPSCPSPPPCAVAGAAAHGFGGPGTSQGAARSALSASRRGRWPRPPRRRSAARCFHPARVSTSAAARASAASSAAPASGLSSVVLVLVSAPSFGAGASRPSSAAPASWAGPLRA